jgi:ubiquinone/menaquinone biosynthesis C-methylase UbiE
VTKFFVANAEATPVADTSCDVVTSIFMFHELPPAVRRTVFGEFSKVMVFDKPG